MTPQRFRHVELIGELVRLRPIRADDAPPAYELLRDGVVTRTLRSDGPSSITELADSYRLWERDWTSSGERHAFAMEELSNPGQIIGSIRASRHADHPQQVVIGYWLGEAHWGKGYATEATRLAVHFAFRYLDAVRVFAEVFVGNEASRRVLEKNGFHLDGTMRQHVLKHGEWRDRWFFTLLSAEWEARQDIYRPVSERIVPVQQRRRPETFVPLTGREGSSQTP